MYIPTFLLTGLVLIYEFCNPDRTPLNRHTNVAVDTVFGNKVPARLVQEYWQWHVLCFRRWCWVCCRNITRG